MSAELPALFARVGARLPVIQAPMAGAGGVELAAAVIAAGGVGSLPCAMLDAAGVIAQAAEVRPRAEGPLNLNFWCHTPPPNGADDADWRAALAPYYAAEGVEGGPPGPTRRAFDLTAAEAVERVRPEIVSFHFGLPAPDLLERVRATGALVIASATTVAEAEWLARSGCDAVIAQGFEAGGHAGYFLAEHAPVGLMSLVPAIADAVDLPVIAAGGIADTRGVRAATVLGASGVQVGTAYLATPESRVSAMHRARLGNARPEDTVFTNLLTGRFARGLRNRLIDELGPVSSAAQPFPLGANALAPLRAAAEREGRADYSPLWAGQGVALAHPTGAGALTRELGEAALAAMEEA